MDSIEPESEYEQYCCVVLSSNCCAVKYKTNCVNAVVRNGHFGDEAAACSLDEMQNSHFDRISLKFQQNCISTGLERIHWKREIQSVKNFQLECDGFRCVLTKWR